MSASCLTVVHRPSAPLFSGVMHEDGHLTENATGDRRAKRKVQTRVALLRAAYEEMAAVGIDNVKIRDITDRADVGFGTFYNYFTDRDDLASQVLDCIIHDVGQRNAAATEELKDRDPALVIPVSQILFLREAVTSAMWRWWALRPDLLVDRMRAGGRPFGLRDMRSAIRHRILDIDEASIESYWGLACWMMVGGIHDMVTGTLSADSVGAVIEKIMRMMGMDHALAHRVATTPLPDYPPSEIDWTFDLKAACAKSRESEDLDFKTQSGDARNNEGDA